MAVLDIDALVAAAQTSLSSFNWPTTGTIPTVYKGRRDQVGASGNIAIVAAADMHTPERVAPGNLSEKSLRFLALAGTPWNCATDAEFTAADATMNNLGTDLLRWVTLNRNLGGYPLTYAVEVTFSPEPIRGPDNVQIYLCASVLFIVRTMVSGG